jgi:hypothetical protein
MNKILKPFIYALILLTSYASFAQDKNYELETKFMGCMYNLFEDDGVKLKTLIKEAEQKLIKAKLLKDGSGESYITLYKNIETVVDGRISSFGISNHVISAQLQGSKNPQTYATCMNGILTDPNYEGSKLGKFIALSTAGNDPKISALASQMLEIFKTNDFRNDFYKYLTLSLLDKYNASNKK